MFRHFDTKGSVFGTVSLQVLKCNAAAGVCLRQMDASPPRNAQNGFLRPANVQKPFGQHPGRAPFDSPHGGNCNAQLPYGNAFRRSTRTISARGCASKSGLRWPHQTIQESNPPTSNHSIHGADSLRRAPATSHAMLRITHVCQRFDKSPQNTAHDTVLTMRLVPRNCHENS